MLLSHGKESMGVETDRFVDNLPQEALCSLCCLILKEPVRSPCGHYLCWSCWDGWQRGPSSGVCPYCYAKIVSSEGVKRSQTVWKLVLNFNVYCPFHKEGCTAVYKLALEDVHLQSCPYNVDNLCEENYLDKRELAVKKKSLNNCRNCQHTIENAKKHDCLSSLLSTVKTQKTQITNLEYENDRLSLRLTTKENGIMDQLIDAETQFQQEALNYELEIRELRTKMAALEGELKKQSGEIEAVDLTVTIERQSGSLGLNIIGGDQEGKDLNGIFISRIAEDGPASKPGKLQLNDRVIEVNGFDLRNASHEDAVHAFKNSHGPVRMLIRRNIEVDKRKWNVATQTDSKQLKSCDLTDSALMSCCSEAEESLVSISENGKPGGPSKGDLYDSAYDTLLTQKSSRNYRMHSHDESVSPVQESKDVSSESCEDDRTITPSTVVNGYGSSSPHNRIRDTSPPCGSVSTDDGLSPVHEVKLRRNSNGQSPSPRKVIRRSTYYLVDESIDGSFSSIINSISGESKVAPETNSTVTTSSNDLDVEYEYEYEEVVLVRAAQPTFGINLCYGGEDSDLGVYVEKIDAGSVAEKNGRVFVGDQLIQLNNAQIRNLEDASKMLCQTDDVKILLARPVNNGHLVNGFKSDFHEDQLSSLRETDNESETKSSQSRGEVFHEQDDLSPNEFSSLSGCQQECLSSANDKRAVGTRCFESGFESMVDCNRNTDCTKYVENKNGLKDDVKLTLKDYVLSRLRGQDKGRSKGQESDYSSQSEVSRERTSEGKCKGDTDSGTLKLNRKENRKDTYGRKEKQDRSSSSSPAKTSDFMTSPTHQSKSEKPVKSAMKKEFSKNKSVKHVRVDTKSDWTATEKRVWEEFKIIQNMEAEEGKGLPGVEAEWKVRRSKDGKHIYIRKQSSKPNKSRFLKERAERLCAERTGITTDDDANTIYLGKFWNKEERKRQLLRHRLKREKLLERKVAKDAVPPNPMDTVMADIVQKRMTAPGHVFDDFLTVEEILAQRNKDGFLQGPIHVTTV